MEADNDFKTKESLAQKLQEEETFRKKIAEWKKAEKEKVKEAVEALKDLSDC